MINIRLRQSNVYLSYPELLEYKVMNALHNGFVQVCDGKQWISPLSAN